MTDEAVKSVVRAHDDIERKAKEAKSEVERTVDEAKEQKKDAERTKQEMEDKKKEIK